MKVEWSLLFWLTKGEENFSRVTPPSVTDRIKSEGEIRSLATLCGVNQADKVVLRL